MSVSNYKFHCDTENNYQTQWNQSTPTQCNNGHTDISDIVIMQTISNNNVNVLNQSLDVTDTVPLSYYYQQQTVLIDIPAQTPNTLNTINFSYPFDCLLWTARLDFDPIGDSDIINDVLNFIVYPNWPIETLSSNAISGTNTITVSNNMVGWLTKGCAVKITDGINTNDCGMITNVIDNGNNQTVVFQTNLTNNFNSGSNVLLNVYVFKNHVIKQSGYGWAQKGMKYKTIPANTPMQITYLNKTGDYKSLSLHLEYFMI